MASVGGTGTGSLLGLSVGSLVVESNSGENTEGVMDAVGTSIIACEGGWVPRTIPVTGASGGTITTGARDDPGTVGIVGAADFCGTGMRPLLGR